MGELVQLTDSNHDNFLAEHPTAVVIYMAPWCGPCRHMSKHLPETAAQYNGSLAFGVVNTDVLAQEKLRACAPGGITQVPSIVFYRDGKVVDKMVGVLDQNALYGSIQRNVGIPVPKSVPPKEEGFSAIWSILF